MHCLLASYYTSPESWGHFLSFCDDNDNDKDTRIDKDKDKDEDNYKDKVLKGPITCYIFENIACDGSFEHFVFVIVFVFVFVCFFVVVIVITEW